MSAVPFTRRAALQQLACGFGYLALAGLAAQASVGPGLVSASSSSWAVG